MKNDGQAATSDEFKALIASVVVTFHPDEGIPGRLAAILDHSGYMVVVDNGSTEMELGILRRFTESHPGMVELIENGENLGVATALNRGASRVLEKAKQGGLHWLLLMDQDSSLYPNYHLEMFEMVKRVGWTPQGMLPGFAKIGVLGVGHFDPALGVWYDPLPPRLPPPTEMPDGDVRTVITSGSMVPISTWREIGGMMDDLFIDHVDHEYCLRARKLGYRVLELRKPLMTHHIGSTTIFRFWPAIEIPTSNHSAFRWYYFIRNYWIVLFRISLKDWRWGARCGKALLLKFFVMCIFEKDRPAKVLATFKGAKDGVVYLVRSWITGRSSSPS